MIFPNLLDKTELPDKPGIASDSFIYVGSLDKRKGFAEFYDLVEKAPSHQFTIIGRARDKTGLYYLEKLKSFKNVALLGRLNHKETLEQINISKALISTSPMEGFPNTFIESWACGKPVLSLYVDPGNVIVKENLGFYANGNINSLLDEVYQGIFDCKLSERTKAYVSKNHILNEFWIKELSSIFENLSESDQIQSVVVNL